MAQSSWQLLSCATTHAEVSNGDRAGTQLLGEQQAFANSSSAIAKDLAFNYFSPVTGC
jgi:hypothetical protein